MGRGKPGLLCQALHEDAKVLTFDWEGSIAFNESVQPGDVLESTGDVALTNRNRNGVKGYLVGECACYPPRLALIYSRSASIRADLRMSKLNDSPTMAMFFCCKVCRTRYAGRAGASGAPEACERDD